jgi:hypothetical protein
MPTAAFWLKENRGGTCDSRMCDNEHARASLGDSEKLSVQHSVGEPIPEFRQTPEEGAERPSLVNRQGAGDVFPDNPPRRKCSSQSKELQRQASSSVGKTLSDSSDGEGLAWSPSDEKVNWSLAVDCMRRVDEAREVAIVLDLGVVMRKHRARERLDFREPRRFPP